MTERWEAELGLVWQPGVGLHQPGSQVSGQYRQPDRPGALWVSLLSPLPPSYLAALSSLLPAPSPGPGTCYYWGGSHYRYLPTHTSQPPLCARMFDGTVASLGRPGCRHTLVWEPLAGSVKLQVEFSVCPQWLSPCLPGRNRVSWPAGIGGHLGDGAVQGGGPAWQGSCHPWGQQPRCTRQARGSHTTAGTKLKGANQTKLHASLKHGVQILSPP